MARAGGMGAHPLRAVEFRCEIPRGAAPSIAPLPGRETAAPRRGRALNRGRAAFLFIE